MNLFKSIENLVSNFTTKGAKVYDVKVAGVPAVAKELVSRYSARNEFILDKFLSYREFDVSDIIGAEKFCKYLEAVLVAKNGSIAYFGSEQPLELGQLNGLIRPLLQRAENNVNKTKITVAMVRAKATDGSVLTILGDFQNGTSASYSAVVQQPRARPDEV